VKKLAFLLVLSIAALTACKNESKPTIQASEATTAAALTAASETFAIDSTSSIAWEGYEGLKLGKSEHNGSLKIGGGSVQVTGGMVSGGSFSIPLSSLTILDIPASDKGNAKLKGHLLNADFFDAAKFPTADFSITSVAKTVGDSVAITGNLTLKGTAKSVTIPALVKMENGTLTASTPKFYINRKDWGMHYGTEESLGDELLRPEIGLMISLVAKK
jgi:polyisoprenoid-binding protein YceI